MEKRRRRMTDRSALIDNSLTAPRGVSGLHGPLWREEPVMDAPAIVCTEGPQLQPPCSDQNAPGPGSADSGFKDASRYQRHRAMMWQAFPCAGVCLVAMMPAFCRVGCRSRLRPTRDTDRFHWRYWCQARYGKLESGILRKPRRDFGIDPGTRVAELMLTTDTRPKRALRRVLRLGGRRLLLQAWQRRWNEVAQNTRRRFCLSSRRMRRRFKQALKVA